LSSTSATARCFLTGSERAHLITGRETEKWISLSDLFGKRRKILRFRYTIGKIADYVWQEMMKRTYALNTLAVGLAFASSILVLHAQNQLGKSRADGAVLQEAKSSFESVCAGCHGLDGRGGERGPDVVSRREAVAKSDADLLNVVRDGRPSKGMPAFSSYGDKQLVALVAYLRELQGAGKPQLSTGDPARGRQLFFGKARCSECHMVSGQGGFFSSELTGFAAKKTADELRTAIVSPEKDRDPRKGPVTVKLADATVLTGMPRNEDNFSLQLQTSDGSFHLLKKADIVILARSGHSAISADHGQSLSPSELNDLVGFLVRTASAANANKSSSNTDEGDEE
jgi:cytochrome c oxidase cbb3-type subunit 3